MKGSVILDKIRGTWYFSFDRGKDPFTGKRRQIKRRGFATKRDAQEAMIKLQAEILNDEFTDLSQMNYATYLEEWMKERSFHLQESTYEIHKRFLKNVIKPRLGHFKLQQIQPIHMQTFVNDLVTTTDYSPHTIHLVFRIISASLKKAKVLKLIKDNPTVGITLPKIRKTEMNIWTLEQVNHFLREGESVYRPTRVYIACIIALLTGMRQGEIMAIRWSDIDFDKQIIYVRQTLTQAAEIKVGAKNASSIRSVHIPMKLIEELETHKQTIIREKKVYQRDYKDHDLVVCARKGNPMIPRNCRKEFYNLTEKLGLPKIRFHDLRHTHATMLIQQNVNVKLISERLGHTDIQTTLNTYSHVLPTMQRSVADKLDEIFG
ncbi:site-specific integrase [Bacillus sp. DX4.1]|uniref:site-specific integrase n=1 Tax=Bacillus sp. DX4.1 TaxID=3055867 RepID=UPI0025A105EC|nr:site-specific integrase [Bacillus sp. DX4.1]MDM5187851.1 site-specific integrase [Bacillus sp. DX4.1]